MQTYIYIYILYSTLRNVDPNISTVEIIIIMYKNIHTMSDSVATILDSSLPSNKDVIIPIMPNMTNIIKLPIRIRKSVSLGSYIVSLNACFNRIENRDRATVNESKIRNRNTKPKIVVIGGLILQKM